MFGACTRGMVTNTQLRGCSVSRAYCAAGHYLLRKVLGLSSPLSSLEVGTLFSHTLHESTAPNEHCRKTSIAVLVSFNHVVRMVPIVNYMLIIIFSVVSLISSKSPHKHKYSSTHTACSFMYRANVTS